MRDAVTGTARLDWTAQAGGPIRGTLRVPGDKSISHRAMMLGAIAEGTTRVRGFLEGEDTLATAAAFVAMGVTIEAPSAGERIVHGVGRDGLRAPARPLDLGNAGTGIRLLSGLLAAQRFESTLVGDESLSKRPMRRVIDPLAQMGARIAAREGGLAPLLISPVGSLRGIDYRAPVASAQVKSCVLLAGLYADGVTRVAEAHPTRDHTERMLAAFGVGLLRDGEWVGVRGHRTGGDAQALPVRATDAGPGRARRDWLAAVDIDVPADISSAAFFIVAASIVPGSELVLTHVGLNPQRTGVLRALALMGADIAVENARTVGGEPVGDLRVRAAELRGIDVPVELVPDMIDEFPILFAAAAFARGTTRVTGAAELRVKESDRIAVMAKALRALGVAIGETADGAVIVGGDAIHGGEVDSAGDHRCAMALSVAALRSKSAVHIADCANVATSFPGYVGLANRSGFSLAADP